MKQRAPARGTPVRRIGQSLGLLLALGVLALTFAAYLHPDVTLDVANQIWSCVGPAR